MFLLASYILPIGVARIPHMGEFHLLDEDTLWEIGTVVFVSKKWRIHMQVKS